MAARNKKGKIHGIFKSAFQISFFHKPSMEEADVYYYIVLEDLILLKMRLLYDIILIIDDVMPLSMTYLEPQYEKLFGLLRDQTSVTAMISLVGNTHTFRQVCAKYDTPIVEKEEFLDCSPLFYNKYKNYCRNDISRYGFYLVSMREDTFAMIDSAKRQEPELESSNVEQPVLVEPVMTQIRQQTQKEVVEKSQMEEQIQPIPEYGAVFMKLWEEVMGMPTTYEINKMDYPVILSDKNVKITLMPQPPADNAVGIVMLDCLSTSEKMTVVDLLETYANQLRKNIRFIGVSDHDIIYNILTDSDKWNLIGPRTFIYRAY